MNQNLALQVLAAIMKWSDDRAREEYSWLRLMARLKYDDYRDFLAGVRFIESLADWLQQFNPDERETAYGFVRNHLIYIAPGEMSHLVELAYPETIQPILLKQIALKLNIPVFRVWSEPDGWNIYKQHLRRTLFLGLSDGARIDVFRRANVGIITNEQVVATVQPDSEKWDDLLQDLKKAEGPDARFEQVFLLDDFTGSGTSMIRNDRGRWKGKLVRFWKSIGDKLDELFEPNWSVVAHHYIGTSKARSELVSREKAMRADVNNQTGFNSVAFTFGMILPEDIVITGQNCQDFCKLIDHYYDPIIETDHTKEGGVTSVRYGFGACALPLVLEHNTPNNSIALLWADTDGSSGQHAMRPLFRRRQRHINTSG